MALLRQEGPQIVMLVDELDRAMPRRVSARPPARYLSITRRLTQLARPLDAAIHPAVEDARALGLRQCSFGPRSYTATVKP
jgi:hypothetical protein